MITEPTVKVIGRTFETGELMGMFDSTPPRFRGIDHLHEFAGRACYQSFHRPNPATAENDAYLAHIIESHHMSVLGHASVTFYITGISRSLTHELIRHRWFTFSELSQRYVDPTDERFDIDWVCPPAYLDDTEAQTTLQFFWRTAISDYMALLAGAKTKAAREAARAVLPNMTETRIVATSNIRGWRDLLAQRFTPHADAEIARLASVIRDRLFEIAPNSMQGA